MIDPPRAEVTQAVTEARSAGIKTIMITETTKQQLLLSQNKSGFLKKET